MTIIEKNKIIENYINSIATAINKQYKTDIISNEMITFWLDMVCMSEESLEDMKSQMQGLSKEAVEVYVKEKQRKVIGLGPMKKEPVTSGKTYKLNCALERKRQELKQKNIA